MQGKDFVEALPRPQSEPRLSARSVAPRAQIRRYEFVAAAAAVQESEPLYPSAAARLAVKRRCRPWGREERVGS